MCVCVCVCVCETPTVFKPGFPNRYLTTFLIAVHRKHSLCTLDYTVLSQRCKTSVNVFASYSQSYVAQG